MHTSCEFLCISCVCVYLLLGQIFGFICIQTGFCVYGMPVVWLCGFHFDFHHTVESVHSHISDMCTVGPLLEIFFEFEIKFCFLGQEFLWTFSVDFCSVKTNFC